MLASDLLEDLHVALPFDHQLLGNPAQVAHGFAPVRRFDLPKLFGDLDESVAWAAATVLTRPVLGLTMLSAP